MLSESRPSNEERKLELTSRIVAAYLSRNVVPAGDLTYLIQQTYSSLSGTSPRRQTEPAVEQRPAVAIKKSVTADFIICLEDGEKYKSLTRHLMARYGLTPEQYREKWGLPADYPMIAPIYARQCSELARVYAGNFGTRARASTCGSSENRTDVPTSWIAMRDRRLLLHCSRLDGRRAREKQPLAQRNAVSDQEGLYFVRFDGNEVTLPQELVTVGEMLDTTEEENKLWRFFDTIEERDTWIEWLDAPSKPRVISRVKPTN